MRCKQTSDRNIQFINLHKNALIWLGAYLFIFTSTVRFDWVLACVSATISVVAMFLFDKLVKTLLIKKLLMHQRQFYYYLVGFALALSVSRLVAYAELSIVTKMIRWEWITILEEVAADKSAYHVFFKYAMLLSGTFAISTISYLLSEAQVTSRKTNELMNEKLDMELRFLKAQINPHFLFNALNNIYSLVYSHEDNAAESILKLSEMLRYVTDECQADKISISKEVKYIDNYIDFQLMRMEKHPNLKFEKQILNAEFKMPPMILQPLVENSFKHSRLETNAKGYLHMKLVQNERELLFTSENTQSPFAARQVLHDRSGIGIANLQKRLDLAYSGNYSLKVDDNPDFYRVELRIRL